MLTKNTDARGRLALGERFANQRFIVTEVSETEIKLEVACVIPAREAWLFNNPKALNAVRRGIEDARAGRFSSNPPDLEAAQQIADQIPDDPT
jgi:hypothetical protein